MKRRPVRGAKRIVRPQCFLFLIALILFPLTALPFSLSVKSFTFPCGTKLVVYEDPSSRLVSIQAWVAVGSGDEGREEEGISHLLEHMMFRGAERGGGLIAKEVEAMGGYINAYTSYDHTVYHLYIDARHWRDGLSLLARRIFEASFKRDDFEKEKEVVIEETRMNRDNPERFFRKAAISTFYPDNHPYHHPIIGNEKLVRSFSLEELYSYYREHYTPDRITFIVSGGVEFDKVKSFLGGIVPKVSFKKKALGSHSYSFSGFTRKAKVFVRGDAGSTRVMVMFPIPGVASRDLVFLDALSSYLSDGRTSPLVRQLREEKGLFRHIYAYSFTPKREGAFMVYGELMEGVDPYVAVSELLKVLWNVDFSAGRMRRVKTMMKADLYLSLDDLNEVARYLGYFQVDGGDYRRLYSYMDGLESMGTSDFVRVWSEYIRPDRASLFVLSPKPLDERKFLSFLGSGESWKKLCVDGVKVLMLRRGISPTFSVVASMRGGVIFEDRKNNGIFTLISRLLTRGCSGMDSLEFSRRLEDIGGDISGFSGRNTFGLRGSFLSGVEDKALDLFFSSLVHPSFSSSELEKVKKEVLKDIKTKRDNPISYSISRAFSLVYGDRGYGLDPLGSERSISRIGRDEVVSTYREFLVKRNITLVVVGNFDEDLFVEKLKSYMRDVPTGKVIKYPEVSLARPSTVSEKRGLLQDNIVFVFPAPSLNSPDRFSFELMRGILGGQGGLLFREIRDKRSLCYAVFPFYFPGVGHGIFGVYVGTYRNKKESSLRMLRDILFHLEPGSISPYAERGRAYVVGELERSMDTNSDIAFRVAVFESLGVGLKGLKMLPERVMEEPAGKALDVFKRYLSSGASVFVYGP